MLILLLLSLVSAQCSTCLDSSTTVWGVNYKYEVVPNTTASCWGILNCNYAICWVNSLPDVSRVILNITLNNIQPSSQVQSIDLCTEGATTVIGLDNDYRVLPGRAYSCAGILSCTDAICKTYQTPNVTLVAIVLTR